MLDKQMGNLVKADRFGYIKRAMHGTKMLSNREIRYKSCGRLKSFMKRLRYLDIRICSLEFIVAES